MRKIEILNRWTQAVIVSGEYANERQAVENSKANLRGANLRGANLRGANLIEANLRGANLRGANLRGANLRGANLIEAYLIEAYLIGANLIEANLIEANLRGANLIGAYLRGANLIGANLRGANLIEANLRGANLIGAYLIDGGHDSRGHHFIGGQDLSETLVIYAGCKKFIGLTQALNYPYAESYKKPKMTQESIIRVKRIAEIATLRGWKLEPEGEETK